MHIEKVAVAGVLTRSDFATAGSGYIHPASVVCVEIGCENRVAETVTDFVGHNLLVNGIGVGSVAHSRREECATRIERSTADEAEVEIHVVVTVDIEVGTTLHATAEEVEFVGFLVSLVVVEVVDTPVGSIVNRAGEHEIEAFVEHRVFSLCKCAFLSGVSHIVAIHHVTHTEFLIFPVGVGSGSIVYSLHILTARVVHEVFTIVEVNNLVVVATDIVADIETGGEHEFLREKFVAISRNNAIPLVVVVATAHNHVRTGSAVGIHLLDFIVGKSAVGFAEESVHNAIGSAIP